MRLPHRIVLGSVAIDGTDTSTGVSFSDVKGWYDLPDARGSVDAIPGAHGAFRRVDVWREPRAITVTGSLHASTRAEYEELRARVIRGFEQAQTLTVVDETGAWSAAVEVDRADVPDYGAWATVSPFTVDLIAPDPVRYREWLTAGPVGLPTQVGGLILPKAFPWDFGTSSREVATVVNDGTVPLLPRVTVTGSADSITVFGGARRMEFGGFDGTLVLDSLDRRAFLNGVDVTRDLVRRDWPVVAPGGVADFYFTAGNPSADISLMVEYRIGVW